MSKTTITKEEAIVLAQEIFEKYPQAKDANEAIYLSQKDDLFKDETTMLATWGRLLRLYSRKASA